MNRAAEKLQEYRRKRDFTRTLEPAGEAALDAEGHLYVMHMHAASHDHFDLRLEQDGVLRSWALPKGPSLEPGEKRLAVEVEDHPLEYGSFEGVIPEREYGGGTVMLWDTGRWRVNGKNDEGHIDFTLDGQKLKGNWTLVRTRGMKGGRAKAGKSWLLIKRSDEERHALRPENISVVTGRNMEEIARDKDNAWIKGRAVAKSPVPVAKDIPGGRRKALPGKFVPQLATLADKAPAGDGWIHEIKLDGYRIIARLDQGKVTLLTRNLHDWTHRFPELAQEIRELPVKSAILDGEVVSIGRDGSSSFRNLQEALSRKQTGSLSFHVFDLPYLDGFDLTAAQLIARKKALQAILANVPDDGRVRYSDHIEGNGPAFYDEVCALGLEGIISKRPDAPYRSTRNRQWLKAKCTWHEEFVVGGYTPPGGARDGFGALLLGAWKDGSLEYAGRVGTGFSTRQLAELHKALKRKETKTSPFAKEISGLRNAHWVKPDMVVEVEFTERTRDGRLRHPVFRGVRDDRDPREIIYSEEKTMSPQTAVHRERHAARRRAPDEAEVAGVRITNPDRVMYPEQGVTKLDLAQFYEDIHEWVLPWLARRPLSLLRCPEGHRTECFFQKHPGHALAKHVPRISIPERKGSGEYVYVQTASHLVALIQAGVLEFHPWGCLVDDVEHPDIMVFDLDPSPEVPWREMRRTAIELRDRLESLGLSSFLRTTGGKGLHLVVPLKPKAGWDAIKDFSKAVAERAASDDPDRLTANMAKSRRTGRIFIDYLRNGRGNTAIASYSVRAREGAPVAVPVRWDELGAALQPDRYNIDNLRRRLGALKKDPWEGFFESAVALDAKLLAKVGLK